MSLRYGSINRLSLLLRLRRGTHKHRRISTAGFRPLLGPRVVHLPTCLTRQGQVTLETRPFSSRSVVPRPSFCTKHFLRSGSPHVRHINIFSEFPRLVTYHCYFISSLTDPEPTSLLTFLRISLKVPTTFTSHRNNTPTKVTI